MRFLDLPPDIAHIIYDYYFASHLVRITTTEKVDADYVHDDVVVTGWNELLPLLLTCKQIYTTAGPYLNKATVRVDMIEHYHGKLVSKTHRPNVTQYLVPAIEHVWKCISRFTMLNQEIHAQKTPRAYLSNFQICLYDLTDPLEHATESEDAAATAGAASNLPAEIAAGRYDSDMMEIAAMNAFQTLARLKPSMPNIAFAEIYVVFLLEVSYRTPFGDIEGTHELFKTEHLLRYLPDTLLNADGKILWRRQLQPQLDEQPVSEIPLIGCDPTFT